MSLTGKVALVTGSARGIGAACVRLLAARGASVIVNYVSSEGPAVELAKEVEAKHEGIKAVAIKADLSTVDGPAALAEASLKAMGRVDILVHNAGINGIPQGGGWDSSAEIYESVMNCNVRGPFLLNQALIPHLAPGSAILFFSTGLAKMTNLPPQTLIYNMTKGATEQAARVLCKGLGPKGIRVNVVAPGPTATELFLKPKTQEEIDMYAKMSPFGRLGQVEDIAKVVAFLVSDEAGWVSGQTLHAGGGLAV